MYLESVTLESFRSFAHQTFCFQPGIVMIHGDNGSGKTSLIESMHLLSSGSSFRTHRLPHLIRLGQTHARVHATYHDTTTQHLTLEFGHTDRIITFDHKTTKTLSSLLGKLLVVSITPHDTEQILIESAKRRSLIDLSIAQIDPLFLSHSKRYCKGLKIKNQLLKTQQYTLIAPYEVEMAKSAEYIQKQRLSFCHQLQTPTATFVAHLTQKTPKVSFDITPKTAQEWLETWQKAREHEKRLSYTTTGPHRDTLTPLFNDQDPKIFSSEGEKKVFVIALKLALHQILNTLRQQEPILVIDDISAHLDPKRLRNFLKLLTNYEQVFLTESSTIPESLPHITEHHTLN